MPCPQAGVTVEGFSSGKICNSGSGAYVSCTAPSRSGPNETKEAPTLSSWLTNTPSERAHNNRRARSKQRRRDRLIAASTTSPRRASMATGRMVTSSRRAGRITNKSRLLVYRGSDKVDLSAAETIVWNNDSASESANKHNSLGAKGVESGELLVSLRLLFTFLYACDSRCDCRSPPKRL